jgi:hypothetical protein
MECDNDPTQTTFTTDVVGRRNKISNCPTLCPLGQRDAMNNFNKCGKSIC